MANIFDYILWRGDLTFEKSPFNPVDNIVFSQLSYLPLDGIVPGPDEKHSVSVAQAAAIFAEKLESDTLQGHVVFKDDPAFFQALSQAERFRNCELHSYVNNMDIVHEKQFAALCVHMADATFVAYRGTDASVVGWKEDFNMSFSPVIPAQLDAVSYLEKIAAKVHGPLIPGGHSKGGNLAIYASSSCGKNIQHRITGIYSNDSPGFHRSFIESEGYRAICRRIYAFVPQSSIVGMLLEHGNEYTAIKSSQKGIFQHELYSWEVTHDDMVRLADVNNESRFIDKTMREWLNSLDDDHLKEFSSTLFGILADADVKSFTEDGADWLKAAVRMIQSAGNIDPATRKSIRKMLSALFTAARNNIDTFLPEGTPGVSYAPPARRNIRTRIAQFFSGLSPQHR